MHFIESGESNEKAYCLNSPQVGIYEYGWEHGKGHLRSGDVMINGKAEQTTKNISL